MSGIGTTSIVGFGTGTNLISNYTTTYGCNFRFALSLKMPPATSDSNSGNLPSDDLSEPMAINKVRLKVQIHIANEDTNYAGF
jgi:hypothetical protein